MKQDDWGPWNSTQQGNQNPNQGMQQGEGYPPGYPPPGGGFPPGYKPPGHGMAIASMVLGILSLVFWIGYIGYIIMAPLAIIFGLSLRNKEIQAAWQPPALLWALFP